MDRNLDGNPYNHIRAIMLGAFMLLSTGCASMLSGGDADPPGDGVNQAPIIVGNTIAASISSPVTGQSVRFSITASDPENRPLTVSWDDGNASAGEFEGNGSDVFWSTASPGTYTIRATVHDEGMLQATATTTIQVGEPPVPPGPNVPPAFDSEGIEGDVAAPVAGQKVIFSVKAADADGDPLQFIWQDSSGQDNFFDETVAEDGTAKASWRAPQAGQYTITAIANDGKVSAKVTSEAVSVSTEVTVAALPATFKYVGAAHCSNCHEDTYDEWSTTAHASFETRFQQTQFARRESCRECHAVGFNDGGYIDYELTPQFANVQCESCHGSGIGHPANGPLPVSYDPANNCGMCHTGPRYGTYDEWLQSRHMNIPNTHEQSMEANCVRCHNGEWFVRIQIDGEEQPAENLTEEESVPIGCATCHDPHNQQYESQLRVSSSEPSIIPFDDTSVMAGKASICLRCHNGRRNRTNMETTIAKGGRGFHANSQGPMLFGVGHADIGVEFDTEHPHNTWNNDKCVTCHMYEKEYENADNPGIFGHSFKARYETCLACHANTTVEGMEQMSEQYQLEIQALMHEFEEVWPAQWKTVDGENVTLRNAPDTQDPPRWDGPPVEDPVGNAYREAWWNYTYVEEDFSLGIHNPDYARRLLETAIARVNELNAAP